MAGRSENDERTWNIPFAVPDFTTYCKDTDLSGITIAKVVDNADFPDVEEFMKLNQQVRGIVRASKFKRDIVRYLQTLEANPNHIHSAEDIIGFTKSFAGEEHPDRDIGKFLWTQAEGIDVNTDKYREMVSQGQFYGGEVGILGAMEKHGLDLLTVPLQWASKTTWLRRDGVPRT
ncbi:uncharacterized protein PODANS_4_3445 [Podospora anserina S mat+]|uniref:Podospora anserina S mat+ genomic DNA chromosome 4, supercontig 4 n=1 Tax=Podospora anserina (strain S / ATCC MYA-4624 / DSM 980 / FGSC 10383) TaxID=515849 RepID=B2AQR2_PODAN|nr:uncharacterized protein PODANS_4_3445 [Podospora anserina S mat+]CAP66490.1 unnamed protein product [Podospora anserina S mat+]CDP28218.1 Putative protein of unknown function [Podospora anserina S mat+]